MRQQRNIAITEEHIDEGEDSPPSMRCPFCGWPTLIVPPNRTYLICQECRRKVHCVLVSVASTAMLLDAFDELLNHSYDKEIIIRSESARGTFRDELKAQGFDSVEACFEGCGGREEGFTIPEIFAKHCGLSRTALQALCEMLAEHDFGEDSFFFENVCRALGASRHLTASQRRLYKQLEVLSFDERKLLSEKLQEALWRGQKSSAE